MKYTVILQVEEEIEVEVDDEYEEAEDDAIQIAIEEADWMFSHEWICVGVRKQ